MAILIFVFLFSDSHVAQKPEMQKKKINTILNNQIKEHKTPSVFYYIFDKDKILYQSGMGFANVKIRKEINENTRFFAYSVTKTFTALAVLQLEEQGKLDIQKPIKEYLPDFRYSDQITIKQLLTHTAGIPNPVPLNWIHDIEEHQTFNRNAFFDRIFIKHNRVKTKPNEKFAYSNLGYVILGQLIERVSGEQYEDYIRKYIINLLPIDSVDLDFVIHDNNRYATGYHKRFSLSSILLGLFIDKSRLMGKPEGRWKPFNFNYVNGQSYGGLIGTPYAFVSYIQEFLKPDCRFIDDHHKEMLFTENYTNSGDATGMCLGWFKGQLEGYEYFMHAGGGGGYYCEIRIYPKQGIGSVIMFNRTGMKNERFLDKMDRFVLKEL
ncbi:MAG: beta-lactamase family protein [Bacteroidales bacterium]|nr:beta-lactamase family protein [Bacteroidales bacterium]